MGKMNENIVKKKNQPLGGQDSPLVIVVDKEKTDGILYPMLQENEECLKSAKNETVPLRHDEHKSFPLEFRFLDIVIDSLARKYNEGEEALPYPEADEDGERFLIGPKAVRTFVQDKGCPCPYMTKAFAAMEEQKIPHVPIAICLLDANDSEINRQEFLALAKNGIYLRKSTLKLEFYPYDELYVGLDRLTSINSTSSEQNILDDLPSETFRKFLQEIMLLRRTTLLSLYERHPLAVTSLDAREKYIDFLTDAAAAEGKLGVRGLIYLEYLTRNFHVSADKLAKCLEEAYEGGIKENEIHKRLTELLTQVIPSEDHYVFFMDIMELLVGENGEITRPKLLKVLKRKNGIAGGEKFVNNFMETVKLRRQEELYMKKALQTLSFVQHRIGDEHIHLWQNYRHELSLKLLDIGVKINEYE